MGTLSFTARIPVFHERKVVPFVNWTDLGTYFDNYPYPLYQNVYQIGMGYTPSRYVTYQATVRNVRQHNQGTPFPNPEIQHYSWLLLTASFHGRL